MGIVSCLDCTTDRATARFCTPPTSLTVSACAASCYDDSILQEPQALPLPAPSEDAEGEELEILHACEHIRERLAAHFANGMCRNCFANFLENSGGLWAAGSADPPAFQAAREKEMKELEDEDAELLMGLEEDIFGIEGGQLNAPALPLPAGDQGNRAAPAAAAAEAPKKAATMSLRWGHSHRKRARQDGDNAAAAGRGSGGASGSGAASGVKRGPGRPKKGTVYDEAEELQQFDNAFEALHAEAAAGARDVGQQDAGGAGGMGAHLLGFGAAYNFPETRPAAADGEGDGAAADDVGQPAKRVKRGNEPAGGGRVAGTREEDLLLMESMAELGGLGEGHLGDTEAAVAAAAVAGCLEDREQEEEHGETADMDLEGLGPEAGAIVPVPMEDQRMRDLDELEEEEEGGQGEGGGEGAAAGGGGGEGAAVEAGDKGAIVEGEQEDQAESLSDIDDDEINGYLVGEREARLKEVRRGGCVYTGKRMCVHGGEGGKLRKIVIHCP